MEEVMTAEEVGKKLRLKELGFADPTRTIRRWASKGLIGRMKIGRKVAFTQRQVDEFMEKGISK